MSEKKRIVYELEMCGRSADAMWEYADVLSKAFGEELIDQS